MIFENKELTPVSQLGEFGLIDHLTQDFKLNNPESVYGIGDDCAVINNGDHCTLITTDLLMEGVHFDLTYVPLKHLGYKAVAVNISDVIAMNAIPRQITVSLALSSRFTVEALEDLYAGIQMACEKFKIDLVGGDTTTSRSGLCICITAIGLAKKEEIVYRKNAKVNDLICVSGDLGGAYAGLLLLEREKEVFLANPKMNPEFAGFEYILERQLKPEARLDVMNLLKEAKIKPNAMIDISDGLSSEIIHICNQSGTGCKIYEDKIPIDYVTKNFADEIRMDPSILALNGGEDYELLFTIPLEMHESAKAIKEITIIGHICEKEEGNMLVARDGTNVPLKAQGWNAFGTEEK